MRLPGYALDAVVVAAGLIYAAQTDSYGAFLLATVSLTALAAIGLNVLMGLSGQISFGHVGFMAIGAYATAILMERAGWPFSAAMPTAALLAGAIGGVLAVPALRVRGPYLALPRHGHHRLRLHRRAWRDRMAGSHGRRQRADPLAWADASRREARGARPCGAWPPARRRSAVRLSPHRRKRLGL